MARPCPPSLFVLVLLLFLSLGSALQLGLSVGTMAHSVRQENFPTLTYEYQVFVSFSEDTHKNFTCHLFVALDRKGIRVYRSEFIQTELMKAIEKSRIAVVVFSKNYGNSNWCLDELVKIMECKRVFNQRVIPIFYDVSPSEVRKQEGNFAEALRNGPEDKVDSWKVALTYVASLAGSHLNPYRREPGLNSSPSSSAARRYDNRIRKQMDAAKRRNLIKQQAAKKKQDGGQTKGTIPPAPPKRTSQEKTDRPQKKQKITIDPVVALQAEKTPIKHGKGKGLMKGPAPSGEKPPVLFREDSSYCLEKMSSMLTADDYADLGNHSTEAMGETGLFTLGQAMVMMKGLFGRCLNHETSMNRLRQKNKMMEDELHELKTYKINVDRKLKCSEQVRGEVEKENGHLRELLKDKERQLTEAMSKLDNAKELAVQEYRDSDLLIAELGNSFADGFDDALRQVKSSYPDLDVSHVNIDAQGQTLAQSVRSESTDEVCAVNAPADEGEAYPPNQPTDGPVDGNSSPKND